MKTKSNDLIQPLGSTSLRPVLHRPLTTDRLDSVPGPSEQTEQGEATSLSPQQEVEGAGQCLSVTLPPPYECSAEALKAEENTGRLLVWGLQPHPPAPMAPFPAGGC